ncbi:D-arabinono-1,4-lactone oxidase [Arthrobacter sp. efr-133-TYG-120]|uniref:D-arabinono-1,4-lactone oxidase n=1 Tax=Arthrobacter sp. efr-133-TYG-120 TaxID=3040280 RepID=UPI002550AC6B|nr:D-arabinono-1,4-lactone oxidase [Arthrobacter sp. efr-133-TYG-120]
MSIRTTWSNWAGTQGCQPEAVVNAVSVEHVSEIVADATRRGISVRPVGTGHSFAPLVPTDGIVLDISAMSGIIDIDRTAAQVRVKAGTPISAIGEPLWDAGLSLKNQGAIDLQTIAGAVSTSTHGSGLQLTALSGAVVGAELITASGELERIGPNDPRLPALRASMGLLGILVSVDLQLEPAFKLKESLTFQPFAEVLDRWDEGNRTHRHFSFVRGPMYDMSAVLPPLPNDMDDPTLVRIFDTVDADTEDDYTPAARVNRPYRIYPDHYPTPWEEVEYFVPYDTAHDAFAACLPVMNRFPDEFPMEVRTVARDESWLSPMYGRDSVAIGFCRTKGRGNLHFFHTIDRVLSEFNARPHWGKQQYFLDSDILRARYPLWDDFNEVRRKLDPTGTFLNAALRALFE